MNEIPLAVRLKTTHEAHNIDQTLHGFWIDGTFVYTDHSQGRGAGKQSLSDHKFVAEVTESQNGQDPNRLRTILLGEGVIYRFESISVTNNGGSLKMEMPGENGTTQKHDLNPGQMLGGVMPRTIFQAQDAPGFAIVQ